MNTFPGLEQMPAPVRFALCAIDGDSRPIQAIREIVAQVANAPPMRRYLQLIVAVPTIALQLREMGLEDEAQLVETAARLTH